MQGLKQVTGPILLGLKVKFVMTVGRKFVRYAFNHGHAPAFKSGKLFRVVGQKPNGFKAHLAQHLGRRAINTFIGIKAKFLVGIKRIKSAVLQRIGTQLVHKPDTAPFLSQIKDNPALPAFGNFGNCGPQSHLSDPIKSPVKHSECKRIKTG